MWMHVINYEIASTSEIMLHRIGATGSWEKGLPSPLLSSEEVRVEWKIELDWVEIVKIKFKHNWFFKLMVWATIWIQALASS